MTQRHYPMVVILDIETGPEPVDEALASALLEALPDDWKTVKMGDPYAVVDIQHGFPVFSVTCYHCDCSEDVIPKPEFPKGYRVELCEWIEAAILDGWRGILHDDGPSWNYIGECPECAKKTRDELKKSLDKQTKAK